MTEVGTSTTYSESLNHLILAFTTTKKDDQFQHIDFYKVVELADGSHSIFDFEIDAV